MRRPLEFHRRLYHKACGHSANATIWGVEWLEERFTRIERSKCWLCITYESGLHCGHYTKKLTSPTTLAAMANIAERDNVVRGVNGIKPRE